MVLLLQTHYHFTKSKIHHYRCLFYQTLGYSLFWKMHCKCFFQNVKFSMNNARVCAAEN